MEDCNKSEKKIRRKEGKGNEWKGLKAGRKEGMKGEQNNIDKDENGTNFVQSYSNVKYEFEEKIYS